MILRINESREINGRWFVRGQEIDAPSYQFKQTHTCTSCTFPTKNQYEKFWTTIIDGVTYELPDVMCAILDKEIASTDQRGDLQKLVEERVKDPAACYTEGHTDVVKQARQFLGIEMNNYVDVDQERLELLKSMGYEDVRDSGQ